jgi:aminoglycoside phosphotransferase (APT) family kinase protein
VRTWELEGGVSAHVVAYELGDGSRLVARSHPSAEFELDVLRHVAAAGIPVPAPRHAEPGLIVMEYVEGECGKTAADPAALADVLRQIHRVEPPPFLRGSGVLLHGDFWPGNTLWRGSRVVAVLDWEDATLGDPLADVGNARLELLWSHGDDAKEEFTRAYGDVDRAELAHWDLQADARLTPLLGTFGLEGSVVAEMLAAREGFVAAARAQSGKR